MAGKILLMIYVDLVGWAGELAQIERKINRLAP